MECIKEGVNPMQIQLTPVFGDRRSLAKGQIGSLWRYGVLTDTQALETIFKNMDMPRGVSSIGRLPKGVIKAFQSHEDASFELMKFAHRQRGLYMAKQPVQENITMEFKKDKPVTFNLLDGSRRSADVLAYKVSVGEHQYALIIAKNDSDAVNNLYAKWRNLYVTQRDRVQNVPRLHFIEPTMGWMLVEFIDEDKHYNLSQRGTKRFSQFLNEHNLVYVSAAKDNHVNGMFVDLGHIMTKAQYEKQLQNMFGTAEELNHKVAQIENRYFKS